ncbi:MAG: TadE family type IV pilus minor pilin [Aeromicrobium sp.]|uniref:TadE family type IV pilus minor pilin n=1 Tax=Aeromicrobium sp. TaxID=1871063 RepID=UPI0039E47DEF
MKRPHRDEDGMATAELAVVAPFGVTLLVLALWLVSLGYHQIRLTDAAREAARVVARGDDPGAAEQLARELSPDGAEVEIDQEGGLVTVTVSARSSLPGDWFDGALGRDLESSAVAAVESP